MRFSEETRRKMSEAALKRWRTTSVEEKELIASSHSEKMKEYWATKTPEERRAAAYKIAESRRRNKNDSGKV